MEHRITSADRRLPPAWMSLSSIGHLEDFALDEHDIQGGHYRAVPLVNVEIFTHVVRGDDADCDGRVAAMVVSYRVEMGDECVEGDSHGAPVSGCVRVAESIPWCNYEVAMDEDRVLRRISKQLAEKVDAMVPHVQEAFPEATIRKSDVLGMVIKRGIDELLRDIQMGRVR